MLKQRDSSPGQALTCPLLALRPETLDDSIRRLTKATGPAVCLREQCGWWDEAAGQCAMVTIAGAAQALAAR